MNIERAKRALDGQAILFAPNVNMGDRHRITVDVTPEFRAAIEDLAYEQGNTVATFIRKTLKEHLQNAIYAQEAREGRYNAPPAKVA